MKTFVSSLTCMLFAEGRELHTHRHTNATKVIRESKHHLEKIYGKGLLGLYNEEGRLHMTPQKLKLARRRPSSSYANIGGLVLNQETSSSFTYGMIDGLQYKGLQQQSFGLNQAEIVESNCFYSTYGLLDSVDMLVYDFQNIVDPYGEFKWMNLVAYNPMHILNNTMVEYEMCEMYIQLERLMSILSLDWALITQSITNDIVYMLTDGILAFGQLKQTMSCEQEEEKVQIDEDFNFFASESEIDEEDCGVDYYSGGQQMGEILSRFLMQKLQESKLE